MNIIASTQKILLLHKLIDQENTGTPRDLASRLLVSRTTLYTFINELKSYNAPIQYSRTRRTFFYTHYFEISTCFTFVLNDDSLSKIEGGQYLPSFFSTFILPFKNTDGNPFYL